MAFRSCTSLTSVTIPNSVTSIDHAVFHQCAGLTSIIIPNSVTTIRQSAFLGCTSLTSVIIPNSVTSIELFAFNDCDNLTSVTFQGTISSANFDNTVFQPFPGDLRVKFYATNPNGTPGTYTRAKGSETWSKR